MMNSSQDVKAIGKECNHRIPYLQQLTLMVAKKVEQDNRPEQAYSEVIECSNQLWVPDKRGIMHILLDVGFDYVYYIWHDDLYGKEAFFVIGIHNVVRVVLHFYIHYTFRRLPSCTQYR